MIREIKFRGINQETNEWVYGCLLNNMWAYSEFSKHEKGIKVCEIITGVYESDNWAEAIEEDSNLVSVLPESVGQFTGLLDKKGVEIYEGDILLEKSILINIDKNKEVPNSNHENWYKVFWNEEYSAWSLERIKTTRHGNFGLGKIDWFQISIKTSNSEIIGNIHDNPDLLI